MVGEQGSSDWAVRYERELAHDRSQNDAFVISFPKSGRTWHRLALGCYLAARLGRDLVEAMQLAELCLAAAIPVIGYSHNGANFLDDLAPDHPLVASPDLWRDRPVLLLVRDPRDVLVSAYHHARFRTASFSGDLTGFIRAPNTGIRKIMSAYHRWSETRAMAASFAIVAYEQMLANPSDALAHSLEALGVLPVSREALDAAVAQTSFAAMKQYESQDTFTNARLRLVSGDERARKVREGRRGSYLTHFSSDDLRYVEQEIEAAGGDPFAAYYAS